MTFVSSLQAFALAAGLGLTATGAVQANASPEFCDAAREYGPRSWQALAAYDAARNHRGMNLYKMPQDGRERAIEDMLRFAPEVTAAPVRAQMLNRLRAFDEASPAGRLIIMLQELQGHGLSLSDTDPAARMCES